MALIRESIRDIPDFPKPGIVFKDITPLLADPAAFKEVLDRFVERYADRKLDRIVGIESRGFIFGAPLADRLNVGFVPVRKPGKLPYRTVSEEYSLEYGTDSIEIHADAVPAGGRVLIVDDLLATGGTAAAAASLVRKVGGEVEELAFVVELGFLNGREKLGGLPVFSLVNYE
ncbi:MAG: adenine phosphoribosyltransferase [Pseudomonadota bacterium]